MGMINCPECGKLISDRMSKCPQCNRKIPNSIRYPDFYKNTTEVINSENNTRQEDNNIRAKENAPEKCKNINAKLRKSKRSFWKNIPYLLDRIFLPYAKVAFVSWTFIWIIGSKSLFNDFPSILFGYIFFCGISDLVYYKNKKKYNRYLIKVLEKETKRIEKELIDIDPKYKNIFNSKNTSATQRVNIANYDSMDGHKFEYFCADILRKNGFKDVEVTQGSGDHGIDILAEKDGITYTIQCKCYSSNIGNAAVQQAHTGKSIYHKDIAVVLTNRYFTAQAKEEAKILGVKLWDRDKLNEMIKN